MAFEKPFFEFSIRPLIHLKRMAVCHLRIRTFWWYHTTQLKICPVFPMLKLVHVVDQLSLPLYVSLSKQIYPHVWWHWCIRQCCHYVQMGMNYSLLLFFPYHWWVCIQCILSLLAIRDWEYGHSLGWGDAGSTACEIHTVCTTYSGSTVFSQMIGGS